MTVAIWHHDLLFGPGDFALQGASLFQSEDRKVWEGIKLNQSQMSWIWMTMNQQSVLWETSEATFLGESSQWIVMEIAMDTITGEIPHVQTRNHDSSWFPTSLYPTIFHHDIPVFGDLIIKLQNLLSIRIPSMCYDNPQSIGHCSAIYTPVSSSIINHQLYPNSISIFRWLKQWTPYEWFMNQQGHLFKDPLGQDPISSCNGLQLPPGAAMFVLSERSMSQEESCMISCMHIIVCD